MLMLIAAIEATWFLLRVAGVRATLLNNFFLPAKTASAPSRTIDKMGRQFYTSAVTYEPKVRIVLQSVGRLSARMESRG